jgi:hypothetical protein
VTVAQEDRFFADDCARRGDRTDVDVPFGHGGIAFDEHPGGAVWFALEDQHFTPAIDISGRPAVSVDMSPSPQGFGTVGGATVRSVVLGVVDSVPTRGLDSAVVQDLEGVCQFFGEQVDPAAGNPAAS